MVSVRWRLPFLHYAEGHEIAQGRTLPDYITLQGHPNQWDEKRLGEFVKVVDYLKERGAVFTTASEYYETLQKTQ